MQRRFAYTLLALIPTLGWASAAQNGDHAGEAQPPRDRDFEVPAAPALTPADELATFELPPGYRVELVASDPDIHDPVEIAFDARGRLWVVEMRGLMPDADGTGELDPVGSIATLVDADGDGFFESRTTFADGLVLPRGLTPAYGGVVVILPPKLVWMADRNGDGRVDLVETIDEGGAFEAGLSNPEHAPNAPMMGLDNWLYLANHRWRYRLMDGGWLREAMPVRGQWGLGEDDWGRQLYNYNSTGVRGDRVPPHYLVRNAALGQAQGANANLVTDTVTWPSRVNTGVNRGYTPGILRDDGRLANYTAACGPGFFTGTALAARDRGDTFTPEPAGNLVRHNRMSEEDGKLSGVNAWAKRDFWTSTDERFRPVNIENGPDGALYVVDLYRGILQHRVFLTSFLRRQIEERGLDQPIGLGRIWRVVHTDGERQTGPPPGDLDPAELVAELASANGWTRRTSQRLLVERGLVGPEAAETVAALEQLAKGALPEARLHALWTLDGLGALTDDLLASRLVDETEPHLQAQLIRLTETSRDDRHVTAWYGFARSESRLVRWQLAQSLGVRPVPGFDAFDGPSFLFSPLAIAPVLLAGHDDDAVLREGLLSGLAGRELELFEWLAAMGGSLESEPLALSTRRTLEDIGRCIGRRAELTELERLFALAARASAQNQPGPGAEPLLAGLRRALDQRTPDAFLEPMPASLVQLLMADEGLPQSPWAPVAELAGAAAAKLSFDRPPPPEPTASALEYDASLARGQQVFAVFCAACHQPDGRGLASVAPPLTDPKWLGKPDAELAAIVVGGLSGKIEVAGKTWDLVMPSWSHLTNENLADVLSYVVGTFGDGRAERRLIDPTTIEAARSDL